MQKRRRPRALTLTLPNSKQPFLLFGGKNYTLRNFSQEGIGLWVPPPPPFGLAPGSRVNADIVISSSIFPVQLEIVHQSPRVVGLKIAHKSTELAEIFRHLLEPSTYAAEIAPHPKSGTEDKEMGYPRLWYTGQQGATELLIWYSEPQQVIIALQLCWQGKWVFRQQFKPIQTGCLRDELNPPFGVPLRPESLLIQHEDPDPEFVYEAGQFLSSAVEPLPGHLLWQFLETGEQVFLPTSLFKHLKVA